MAATSEHETSTRTRKLVDEATRPRPERAFRVGLLAGAAIVAAFVIFVVQNRDSVEVSWLFLEWEMPLWITLVGAVVVGFFGYPLSRAMVRRGRARAERRRRATDDLRGEGASPRQDRRAAAR